MTKDGIKTHHSWDKVRWVVASILLLAAIMKAWQLATVPMLGEGLFHARWFNLGLVEFELAFGLWLAFGFFPKLSRWATIGLFTAFAGVSLYKALTGETSCGCFGSAQVNPWWTFVLDTVIVGVSFCCRSNVAIRTDYGDYKVQFTARWILRMFKVAIVLSIVVLIQVILFWGSVFGIIPNLTDHGIVVFSIDESVENRMENEVYITVLNKTERSLSIIGTNNIRCATGGNIKGLPVFVQPGKSSSIIFIAEDTTNQESRSKQNQRLFFYVDSNGIKKISVELPLYKYLLRK